MIKNILVPIDFSDYSKKALEYAVSFAKKFKARMHLVYVIEPIIGPIDIELMVDHEQIHKDIEKNALKELRKLINDEIDPEIKAYILTKNGKPFYEINKAASENDIDLIIISTHGQTGIKHLLFGSTAEKVVRKAPCPVLTLREPIKGFHFKNE